MRVLVVALLLSLVLPTVSAVSAVDDPTSAAPILPWECRVGGYFNPIHCHLQQAQAWILDPTDA